MIINADVLITFPKSLTPFGILTTKFQVSTTIMITKGSDLIGW